MKGLKKTTAARLEDDLVRTISKMIHEAASQTRGAAEEVKVTVVGTVGTIATEGERTLAKGEDHVYIVAVASLALGFTLGMLAHWLSKSPLTG
jgi:hypothetical protein